MANGRRRRDSNRPADGSSSDKAPLQIVSDSIGSIFARTVIDVRRAMMPKKIGNLELPAHSYPVDLELKFKSVSIDKGGVIFNRKQEESRMEINLSTRVLPP